MMASEGLTPEVLIQIYGEEDWTATIEKVDEVDEEDESLSDKQERYHSTVCVLSRILLRWGIILGAISFNCGYRINGNNHRG